MILSVEVREARLKYGDKLYRIETKDKVDFYEPCKICDGKEEITYRDFTFRCPYCGNYRNIRNNITVRSFGISEYYINEIVIEGDTLKKNFKDAGEILKNKPRVTYNAFTRKWNGYGDIMTMYVRTDYIDINIEKYKKYGDYAFFTTKTKAMEILDVIQAEEREKLKVFCKENNCDYVFPF